MNFTFFDLGALLIAIAAGFIVIVLPGLTLACGLRIRIGTATLRALDPLAGVLAGLALLPAIGSLSTRFAGVDFTLVAVLGLSVGALLICWRCGIQRVTPIAVMLLTGWLVLLGTQSIDLDVAGRLYQPIEIFDSVKHAATTQAILSSGAPPHDPFFLRPEHAAYYYFYYTLAALIQRLCGGIVDARMAFAGVTFWAGVGAYAAVRLTLTRLGFSTKARPLLIVAIMGASGLDCLAVVLIHASQHYWLSDPIQWNEQAAVWVEDLVWVPHHVTGLIAGLVGCVALCDASDRTDRQLPWGPVVTAALAFTSCFGLSVWVAFAFSTTLLVWGVTLIAARRWRALAALAIVGLLTLSLAVPQLIDLKVGRAVAGIPIAFTVRAFTPIFWFVDSEPLSVALRLVLLPVNYAFEFGVLTIGAIAAWRASRSSDTFPRLLMLMALSGLLLGASLRSTQFFNDLGWRVLLLPLLAGTAWTVIALDRAFSSGNRRLILVGVVLMGFGWATTLYGLVVSRVYPFITTGAFGSFVAARTDTARDLRAAYEWAGSQMPETAVLQQNPTALRALDFGLYGRQRTAVADALSSLYGADPQAVRARIGVLGPIFNKVLDAEIVKAIAVHEKVDALVVTANDPVWADPASFVWHTTPIYASARVRIIPVTTTTGHP